MSNCRKRASRARAVRCRPLDRRAQTFLLGSVESVIAQLVDAAEHQAHARGSTTIQSRDLVATVRHEVDLKQVFSEICCETSDDKDDNSIVPDLQEDNQEEIDQITNAQFRDLKMFEPREEI